MKNHWIVRFSWMNCMAYEFFLIDKALLTKNQKIILHICKFTLINLFYLQVVITSFTFDFKNYLFTGDL